jgi:UV DNA damage endonuclease
MDDPVIADPGPPAVQPELGLVCITHSDQIRFKTITRKRLFSFPTDLQPLQLRQVYGENVRRLGQAITYCHRQGIHLYRITSDLFPSSDDAPGDSVVEEYAANLRAIGRKATEAGIRLVMHPDQFVVLSSDSPAVIETSIHILETKHARVLDLLGQPRSPWAAMEIHGGKGGRADRLVDVIRALPEAVRSRLVLENDEHAYGAEEILDVCRRTGVPMVFDAHHHVIHDKLYSYEHPSIARMLAQARETWPDPAWQMVHISNGRTKFADPHHSDLITTMPTAFRQAPWIEVEAKGKEIAIAQLRRDWLTA